MFELTGKPCNVTQQKSAQGKPYVTFLLETVNGDRFELSLFGNSMQHQDKLAGGMPVRITGQLSSNSYQDKNGKTRYGTRLQVNSVQTVGLTQPQQTVPIDDLPF